MSIACSAWFSIIRAFHGFTRTVIRQSKQQCQHKYIKIISNEHLIWFHSNERKHRRQEALWHPHMIILLQYLLCILNIYNVWTTCLIRFDKFRSSVETWQCKNYRKIRTNREKGEKYKAYTFFVPKHPTKSPQRTYVIQIRTHSYTNIHTLKHAQNNKNQNWVKKKKNIIKSARSPFHENKLQIDNSNNINVHFYFRIIAIL